MLMCFYLILSCQNDDIAVEVIEEETIEEEEEPLIEEESQIASLPIIFVDTNGSEIVDEPKIDGNITISLDNEIMYEGRIGIEIRGSSSQNFAKKSYGLETRDAVNEDLNVSLLGFPEEEDWILYGPYSDKSLLRNHLIYDLARDMGSYASRTKIVELNLNGSYHGVYIFMEKLKRDKNRIDINKLKDDENSGEDLTGGYIIKIDKESDGFNVMNSFESNATVSGQNTIFLYDYPKPEDISEEQRNYIQDYMLDFEAALASENFTDIEDGYQQYIDIDSFIDFFLLNELSNNVDGYRISTFLHKDKGEKLKAGPIWDFNLAFGNVNYCSGGETDVWAYKFNERCPDDFFQVPFWWGRLLEDPEYVSKLKMRWTALRADILSESSIQVKLSTYNKQLSSNQSSEMNFERWPVLGMYVWPNNFIGDTYEEETTYLKDWIDTRLTWMDGAIADL